MTGDAGFLGSRLCERLVAEGRDVLRIDNYCTGTEDNILGLFDFPISSWCATT